MKVKELIAALGKVKDKERKVVFCGKDTDNYNTIGFSPIEVSDETDGNVVVGCERVVLNADEEVADQVRNDEKVEEANTEG